ncbi:ComF family protein [Secundilactobacillus oryzae]|nr:ComF family protein [Secundilactobacillus oryzae]
MSHQLTLTQLLLPVPIEKRCCCERCWQQFEAIHSDKACSVCGRQLTTRTICQDCQKWQKQATMEFKNRACFVYNEAMQAFMQQYKFAGDYRLAAVFEPFFRQQVNRQKADIVVPIPVSEETMQTRGFNQVMGLLPNVVYQSPLAIKSNWHKVRQSSKNRHDRLQSPQPFIISRPELIAGKSVLIVDDVYTTGRTIRHAAKLIQDAGARQVNGLTLAR